MHRPDLLARLAHAQAQRARDDLLRRMRVIDEVDGPHIVVDGRALLNFASNDYLGLAQHPALRTALVRGATEWGVGATAAHLLGGHRREHEQLTEKLAAWTGRERAMLFSTGYMANVGVLSALLRGGDLCVQDKLNHACLLDGARLAGCELKRYVHADIASAQRQLRSNTGSPALLATDGVFSMDGDIAPLAALATLCKSEHSMLMVDDAHGLGVLGAEGAGSGSAAGLTQSDIPIVMATLGKSIGVSGAFVAGPAALIEGLEQFARTHVYTTAAPPALASAASAAVDIARHESWRRDKLRALIAHFRHGAVQRGIALMDSATPIQPVLVGSSAAAVAIANDLEAQGFFVPAIRPPTVPEGAARLRVTFSATHAESDVERLLDTLQTALARHSAQPNAPSVSAAR